MRFSKAIPLEYLEEESLTAATKEIPSLFSALLPQEVLVGDDLAFSWRSCAPAARHDIKVFHPTAAEPGKAWAHLSAPHHTPPHPTTLLGCCCGLWSFTAPAWDELGSGRGHLQEDFVCDPANVRGNGEKTSENPFSLWCKHGVRDGMAWSGNWECEQQGNGMPQSPSC